MRARLSFEIFGAFLLASLVLVVLTVGALRFFFDAGFRDYVQKKERRRLPYIGRVLETEYAREQGWDRLQKKRHAWYELMDTARELERAEAVSGDRGESTKGEEEAARREKADKQHRPHWLFLLDAEKRPLLGERGEEKPEALIELRVEGETVGWLGLRTPAPRRSPLELAFMEQQYRMFSYLGGGVFLLTGVLTVLLSRRLLAPIRTLMKGTQALASRRFDTRICVRTQNELGRLADDFNRMAGTLEAYETMRKDWLSDISHELRTPLSILQGEIQALQDGVRPLNPDALDSLQAEVDRLARLVESLHFLSLADSEGLEMRRDRIEPIRVLSDRVEAFREPLARAGIALRLETREAEGAFVTGDADRLGRVFTNLLQNTLQYTDGPGTLDIRAATRSGRIQIVFEDSAPGVPDEALSRLFDRLFRVDKSRSRALGGSGLGLSIAQRIVEAHGGRMSAAHSAKGGVKMMMDLPLAGADRGRGRKR